MSPETTAKDHGSLSIHAENIMPIIKKWLYSDKEIFLRELVSNGVDAITKLRQIAVTQTVPDLAALQVDVRLDLAAGTLTVSDNGIGMTADEIRRYINQVAFSGASEFLNHYGAAPSGPDAEGGKGEDGRQIIGHFGLGFYSAFMVADKVQIRSRSYQLEEPASLWTCEGGLAYTLEPTDKAERGTEVILYLSEDSKEFLEELRVRTVLQKYCNFLPIEIYLNGVLVNDQAPLWTKTPTSLKDEDYRGFFRKNYPFEEDPLFWIHLNVDYPFRLQGILYFPKLRHEFDASRGQIKLYCNQVFVAENTQELIPRFLTVLKGMIDCPDIPLNVSRSMLQNDPYVRKISGHITKKVADRLTQLFRTNRAEYERYWADIHPFVKFGMLDDDKFYEACKDIVIFETTAGGHVTVAEYLARQSTANQIFYAESGDTQTTYLELFKAQGLEALLTRSAIDSHIIHFLESKNPEVKWTRIDAAVADHLVDREQQAQVVDADGQTSDDKLVAIFKENLDADGPEIKVESLKSAEVAGLITQGEHERRLKEMSQMWQGARDLGLPDRKTLLVNSASPLVRRLLTETDKIRLRDLARHVYDLARLAHDGLKGEELARFIARSNRLLGE